MDHGVGGTQGRSTSCLRALVWRAWLGVPTGHSADPIQAVVSTARLVTADSTRGRGDRRIDLWSQALLPGDISGQSAALQLGRAGEQLVARRRPVAYRRSALPRLACALPTDRKQPVAGETSKLTECARDHGLINNRRARKHPEHPKPRAALTGRGEVAICGETAWAFQCAPDLVGRGKAAS